MPEIFGTIRRDELLNSLVAIAKAGGDLQTLEIVATAHGLEESFLARVSNKRMVVWTVDVPVLRLEREVRG